MSSPDSGHLSVKHSFNQFKPYEKKSKTGAHFVQTILSALTLGLKVPYLMGSIQ